MATQVAFSDLVGFTLVDVIISYGEMSIEYQCQDGTRFAQFHIQGCCEDVHLEDIDGDISRILNQPIIEASERVEDDEQGSWTFYVIRTNLDSVTMRWYGTSDSRYYAEDAQMFMLEEGETAEKIRWYL